MPISKRWYAPGGAKPSEDHSSKILGVLLEALQEHTVKAGPEDHEQFQTQLTTYEARLGSEVAPSELLSVAHSVTNALEQYSVKTAHFLEVRTLQTQEIVWMLTEAIRDISTTNGASIERLRGIEASLKKGLSAEDLIALKTGLAECLESLREEVRHQKQESDRMVTALTQALYSVEPPSEESGEAPQEEQYDDKTGLPLRSAAEAKMASFLARGTRVFAVAFRIHHLNTIYRRYDSKVGDEVLLHICQCLVQELQATDALYRWNDSALLALLERTGSTKEVRRQLTQLTYSQPNKSLLVDGRSILLNVSLSPMVFPLPDYPSMVSLIESINRFLSAGE